MIINNGNKITISDVAEALEISKTTVSRAISGKGRISEATRKKVLDYIEANDYKPNPMAKGLANLKTYNIGWVIPGDSTITDLPFFQRCMIGVGEVATADDYDLIMILVYDDEMAQLERIVENRKVDGVILGRTLIDDPRVRFLKEKEMPFVVVGSSPEEGVIQIDNDHIRACKELTSILILKGMKKLALIGGDSNHVVNRTRRKGFEQAVADLKIDSDDVHIYMDNEKVSEVERSLEDALKNGAECIICMDDRICSDVLRKLLKDDMNVPEDVKVASFYNSPILEINKPSITSLQYDPKELGAVACRTLLDIIAGEDVEQKVLLGYDVLLKGSTQ